MKIPDKVTDEQLEIIKATEGYIRVASVPGSGKTFVLTYRIAYLITELYVDPASIVALTFTNKAAGEMKQRLKEIIGDKCNCFAGTFHGYCNKILKEEIRTVLAYLRMVYSLADMDFVYTISRPRRGFGKKSIERLGKFAKQQGCSLFEALGAQIAAGAAVKESVVKYYHEIKRLHETYEQFSSFELARQCLAIDYRAELEQDFDQTKLENVTELLTTIQMLEKENLEPIPLEDLLEHFALFTAQDDDTRQNVVRVLTIHTAKGLEFDTVFIPGLIENQFPSYRLKNEDEYEEERRLLYVAMTRAKKMLYLTSYKNKVEGYPSRTSSLLCGIDPSCLNCLNGSRLPVGSVYAPMVEKTGFAVGDVVWHKIFGRGVIQKVDTAEQVYEIQFDQIASIRRIQFRAELRTEEWKID